MTLVVKDGGLFKSDLGKTVNVFVGAGFSTLAKNEHDQILPLGESLKQDLIRDFDASDYASLDLPGIYAVISADRREKLRAYICEKYRVSSFDPAYQGINSIDISHIYTTNVDDLFFKIFERSDTVSRILHDNYSYGAPRDASRVTQYIALHGCVLHDDSDLLFTPGQISSAFASDRETWYVFQRELCARPTLFLGYGMRDAGVLQALHGSSAASPANRWILLREEDPAATTLYESLGFHVMIGSTSDFLRYLAEQKPRATPADVVGAQIPGSIPELSHVARRPIKSFFIGAEPEWSDAYSNQVCRRRINDAVKNSIYSGANAAIVGLPLSGKTTVLKQVAIDVSQDRATAYFDQISVSQVDSVIASYRNAGVKPIVFVDNLLDSRDSIAKLISYGSQIVCAEQSLYFDSLNLPSFSKGLQVHSSSEIPGQDLQRIIDSIPADIRRWSLDDIDAVEASAGEVGLFEAFRLHVLDEALTSRFRDKLAQFESRDPEAFDVYIMACYVSACRAIVSFDMIFMFLNKKNKVYTDVYKVLERIDSFMKDVDLADNPHQDYFSVRSGALARIALQQCSNVSFARVFERFHSAVSAAVIVDYPVFRRYAYDNDFARRAYPVVTDGLRFYERLVKATDNAYDYQHGAIYLSKKKSFTDAFTWIDKAMSISKGRVYSIRNTHARILFEANIDVVKQDSGNSTALEGVRESMKVLRHCIESDVRRSYHLLRFSDQALQYAEVVQDKDARDWLINARDRLREMVDQAKVLNSRESYNLRKYRNLLGQINNMLASLGRIA